VDYTVLDKARTLEELEALTINKNEYYMVSIPN
jgi:hypothetical protein